MSIRGLFATDVTRDIPPVVYFHEQSAARLRDEVSEYIITGGWPEGHANHSRVRNGIHEQYVRLLSGISAELARRGGPELPACWISGFYGSGKSSFAKLLGLSLDGARLPDGALLSDALLARDTSPRQSELRAAWTTLVAPIQPLSVVFDIGAVARDDEQIHSAVVRQIQRRLGYCPEPRVADYELKLERDGLWDRFEALAQAQLGRPWSEALREALAEDYFSQILSALLPETFPDPMSWVDARAGTAASATAAQEAVQAIQEMLDRRAPGRTLFVVVDEVSQYLHSDEGRMLKLQSFVSELGSRLKGRAWLLVTGQQKLEDQRDATVLGKLKDRFPPRLRVHLDNQNILDVVHRRLLQKTAAAHEQLRALYARHRPALTLYAYDGAAITPDAFADVYPLLPGHVDLLLRITSELRTRSRRVQGDDHTIRGLLQLLGELFRERRWADREVGALVTLDEVYDVQHTALDADLQNTMARILRRCEAPELALAARAAKAVALLQILAEDLPTTAELVSQCLYERVDLGDRVADVQAALDLLRGEGLVTFTERHGFAIQSTAGEEWERERLEFYPSNEERGAKIALEIKNILGDKKENPQFRGRAFPWAVLFSDAAWSREQTLADPRDRACITLDVRLVPSADASPSTWQRRSEDDALHDRLLWVTSDLGPVEDAARELVRSERMVDRYQGRRESLSLTRGQLLSTESARVSEHRVRLAEACKAALMSGRLYFRGDAWKPRDFGTSVATALLAVGTRVLPELFPNLVPGNLSPEELKQLYDDKPLSGVSSKLMPGDLGILELERGRYVATCTGQAPGSVLSYIDRERGVAGATLLAHFGSPPYGYAPSVIRACVAGLLRGQHIRIRLEDDSVATAVRDPGVRDLFNKDGPLRRATLLPKGGGGATPQARARLARLFEDLGHPTERDADAIAEAVARSFPGFIEQTRQTLDRLRQLPGPPDPPPELCRLLPALEEVYRKVRHTEPTLEELERHRDTLQDGLAVLRRWHAELSDEAIEAVRAAQQALNGEAAQLEEIKAADEPVREAAARLREALAQRAPWTALGGGERDLALIHTAYVEARRALLRAQDERADAAAERIKARPDFERLSADQAHRVLRPLRQARAETRPEATAPTLRALADRFPEALRRAEQESGALLDELLASLGRPAVVRLDLRLGNREVSNPEEVEALVSEVRARLLEQLQDGVKVRIL